MGEVAVLGAKGAVTIACIVARSTSKTCAMT